MLVAESSLMLGLGSEEMGGPCVRVTTDDDVDPIVPSLKCVPWLLEEDNRGWEDVLGIPVAAAASDSEE